MEGREGRCWTFQVQSGGVVGGSCGQVSVGARGAAGGIGRHRVPDEGVGALSWMQSEPMESSKQSMEM